MPVDLSPAEELSKPSITKRILINIRALLSGKAVNAPLSLVHVWLATRLLGSFDFGLIVMMYAYARTIGDVMDFQSWQTVLQFGQKLFAEGKKSHFQRIVGFSLLLDLSSSLIGFVLGVSGAVLCAKLTIWPAEIHILGVVYCIAILFMATATPLGVLRVFDRYDLIAVQSVSATITRVVGTASLALGWASLEALAAVWVSADIVAWLTAFTLFWREMRRHDLIRGLGREIRSVLPDVFNRKFFIENPGIGRFALNTNLSSTLSLAFGHIGTLIVGFCLGPVSAGYYRIASQLAAGIAGPAKMIQTSVYPEMVRLWRNRATARLHRLAALVALTAGGIGTALLALTFLVGKPLLQFYIGKRGGVETLPLTLWLLTAEVVAVWALPLEPLLFTAHRAGAVAWSRILQCLVFVPLLIIMALSYGLTGVGATTVFGVILLIGIQLLFVLSSTRGKGGFLA